MDWFQLFYFAFEKNILTISVSVYKTVSFIMIFLHVLLLIPPSPLTAQPR